MGGVVCTPTSVGGFAMRDLAARAEPATRATVTQRQLESLLRFLRLPARKRDRIADGTSLSSLLQKLVARCDREGVAWVAWRQQLDIVFFGAELALDLSQERGRPTLRVTVYDEVGKARRQMVWVHASRGKWVRLSS